MISTRLFRRLAIQFGVLLLVILILSLLGLGTKPARAVALEEQTTTPMTHTMPISDTTSMTGPMTSSTQSGMMQGGMMMHDPKMQEEMRGMMGNMQSMMMRMQTMMEKMTEKMTEKRGEKQAMQDGMMSQKMMLNTMMQCHMMMMMQMMQGEAMMESDRMGGMMGRMMAQSDASEMEAMQGMMADMQAMMKNMEAMMGGMMGQKMMQGEMAQPAPAVTSTQNLSTTSNTEEQSAQLNDIEVKATPVDLKNAHEIAFTVDLNANGVDLSFDLAKQATLKVGDLSVPASAWEVAFDHGHHVNGTLKFAHHSKIKLTAGDEVILLLKHPNGKDEGTLRWKIAE